MQIAAPYLYVCSIIMYLLTKHSVELSSLIWWFLCVPHACVEMYCGVEQITTDTTSKHIKDYHHKNGRIKDVKIGFEPLSGDLAGRMEDEGGGEECSHLL